MANKDSKKQLKFSANDEKLSGHYSNMMQLRVNKNEFIMDFFLASPPKGELLSRIITNPSHAKRIANVLRKNIKMYEEKFGEIESDKGPKAKMGFKDN
ncbi:MAG TPA: DUF3467 domain-containing protein [Patescibacteria group bacterium]|nr:DUF3467 domain-containing protein [Patescibacteria group bacterium]